MKKINKFLALLLIAVLAFSLVSCGGKKEEESGGEKEPEEKKFKLALVIGVGGLGDGSFNDGTSLERDTLAGSGKEFRHGGRLLGGLDGFANSHYLFFFG